MLAFLVDTPLQVQDSAFILENGVVVSLQPQWDQIIPQLLWEGQCQDAVEVKIFEGTWKFSQPITCL